jgi:hypothetical protein
MRQNKFPPGWDEKRVQRVLAHYENKTADEALLKTKLHTNKQEDDYGNPSGISF